MARWLAKKKGRVAAAAVVAAALLSVGTVVAAQNQSDTADNAWP